MREDDAVLNALLSSPYLALVGVDHDGVIDSWSAGAASLFGWSAAEAVGQPLTMLAPLDRQAEVSAMQAAVLGGQEIPPVETVRVAKNGSAVPVQLQAFAVRDEQGRPASRVDLYRELPATREETTAVTDIERELQVCFERSPVPQARVSLDARVLSVNEAMSALLGMPADQVVGRDGLTLVHEDDRAAVVAALQELAAGESSHLQLEARVLTAAGTCSTVLTGTTFSRQEGETVLAVAAVDVTDLREAEAAVRVQAERFEAVLVTLPVAVFSYDVEGRCTYSRGKALEALGLEQDQMVGVDLLSAYADAPQVLMPLQRSLAGEAVTVTVELQGRTLTSSTQPLYDEDGLLSGGFGISLDVTEQAHAEQTVRLNKLRLRSLLQHASDVAFLLDRQGRIVYVSPAVRLQLGYTEEQLVGTLAADLDHPDERAVVSSAWTVVADQHGGTASCECRIRHADGSWVWTERIFTNLLDDPVISGLVVNVRETTERRRVEDDLRRLALQDTLTGLPNRTLLLDRIRQALTREKRSESRTALIALDVVDMHVINERFGHDGGNVVLCELAHRLEAAVRPTDSIARMGGDDFALLLSDVASAEDVRVRLAIVLEALYEPLMVGSTTVDVHLRSSFALSPVPDAGTLLAAAERGLRAAQGDPDGGEPVQQEQAAELLAAIRTGELSLHYQPIMELSSGDVAGAEALVRWKHPMRGLIAPSEFIPLAERAGLVVELGEWVLREACSTLAAWSKAGRGWFVGVNLSPRQLVGADFPAVVRRALADTGAPPEQLVIEVTESTLMDDPSAPAILDELRALGVRLALDDFGTGYSSLTYLRRFTVDTIKIDRSFVAGLGRDADDDAIVASVVSLAAAVGKLVVAEGVETVGQLHALRALGVNHAQGFLWSRALPLSELESWLLDRPSYPTHEAAPVAGRSARVAPAAGTDEARILELHLEGASLHTIAAALNAEGRRTTSGVRWTTTTVARVVAELAARGATRLVVASAGSAPW